MVESVFSNIAAKKILKIPDDHFQIAFWTTYKCIISQQPQWSLEVPCSTVNRTLSPIHFAIFFLFFFNLSQEGPKLPPLWVCKLEASGAYVYKDPDARKDWRQKESKVAEDEMVRRHHQLSEYEFGQTPGESEGQGSLACCSPRVANHWTRISDWRTLCLGVAPVDGCYFAFTVSKLHWVHHVAHDLFCFFEGKKVDTNGIEAKIINFHVPITRIKKSEHLLIFSSNVFSFY